MELIKDLLSFFFKVTLGIFFAVLVLWFVSLLFPRISPKVLVEKVISGKDWLPSPRAYRNIVKEAKVPDASTNVYQPGPAFNGYEGKDYGTYQYSSYQYVSYDGQDTPYTSDEYYTSAGVKRTTSSLPKEDALSLQTNRSLTIRNLSIYEGGHVYTGLAFVGEARSTMFREGKFPIIVLDQGGRVVGVSAAIATTDWTVAGWTRFETKIIYTLPAGSLPCTMVFEQGLTSKERLTNTPLRIPFNVKCN